MQCEQDQRIELSRARSKFFPISLSLASVSSVAHLPIRDS